MACAWKLPRNKNASELYRNYSHYSSTEKEIRSANLKKNADRDIELHDLNITLCEESSCFRSRHDHCYCDDLCIHYGDCCADANPLRMLLDRTFNQTYDTKASSVNNTLISFARHSACVKFQVNGRQTSIQVVTKCPDGVVVEAITKCSNYSYELVSHGYGEGEQVVFKNKFCAFCHNLKNNSIKSWRIEMTCFGTNYCVKHVYLPYARKTLRYCLPETSGSLTKQKCSLYKMCMLYVNVVNYEGEYQYLHYKNPHCAVCDILELNRTDDPRLECRGRIFGAINGPHYPTESLLQPSVNLNQLFSLQNDVNIWVDPPKPISCNGFQVYDYDNRICKTVCPYGFRKKGKSCQRISHDFDYSVVGSAAINLSLIAQTNKLPQNVQISSICKDIQNILDVLHGRDTVLSSSTTYDNITNTHRCKFYTSWQATSSLSTLLSGIETSTTAFPIPMNLSVTNFDNSSFHCNGNITQISTLNTTLVNISDGMFLQFSESKMGVNLTGNLYRFFYSYDSGRAKLKSFVYCKDMRPQAESNVSLRNLNCSKGLYGPDDFIYTLDNASVFIIAENRHLKLNESYEIIDDNLIVCIEEKITRRLKLKYVVENYLTIITSTMSILALVTLILIHIVFSELRNFHGKCIICFSVSLLTAHISLIFNDLYFYKFEILCKVSARIEHYAWLCVFSWNSLLAYDIARRFNVCLSLKGKLHINNNSRFAKFTLFGWILPFVFICCNNVVDWVQLGNYLGYAQNNICWVTNINGKLIACVMPIGMMMLFSVLCFCVSLHGIEYSKKIKFLTKNMKRDRNRCIMYTKMSIILGVSWIMAYVTAWTHLDFFDYLNIIVNGLQGLLLLVSFLINSRRILQCKTRTLQKKNVDERSTSY